MKDVTVVTGPMRSGTSCITGLLELCGLDLGQNLEVLRDSTEYNPRGHFELGLLFTINERLCYEASGGSASIFNIPEQMAMDRIAACRKRYFQLFINQFDGELCKDPLMCVTWRYWEENWPHLNQAIFCLRHPLSVAHSMRNRYGISIAHGLQLWQTYTLRFFQSVVRCKIYIFDFDYFLQNPEDSLSSLLQWLKKPVRIEQIRSHVCNFFETKFVHAYYSKNEVDILPAAISKLYDDIRALDRQMTADDNAHLRSLGFQVYS